ncbi:uncharacterized protein LOC101241653 isoform X3 [Hydra vulgaris]|uniref:uncharacterized protein LOC101241653 isoform X3 n=1 Tax=Hydra vulgaris TaxID=6087 RepID=UPI0032EA6AB9
MGLSCKHMFAARRIKKLQMFSANCIAPKWFKEKVQKNHRVFLKNDQHDSHIKFAKLKDKPLTHVEKYCRANRLVQHLSDLAAEGGSSQFECRMRVLQNLASIWGSNKEAKVTSIQHQFVDFNIQNGVSKLEMEDDKFKSELHERKLEITDLSEQVVDVVNVEEVDKNSFDQNYKFERPACSGKVENNAVQNYMGFIIKKHFGKNEIKTSIYRRKKDMLAVIKLKVMQFKTICLKERVAVVKLKALQFQTLRLKDQVSVKWKAMQFQTIWYTFIYFPY